MASKRRQRRNCCQGKHRHESGEAAYAQLRQLNAVGKARPGLHVYKCPFGNHWHVGRRPGRFPKRRKDYV
jgi:hypothetical protein